MEHGFFHPSRGYWQTTGEPSAEILATYPAGTVEVPLKPGADFEWQDGAWVYVEPAVTQPGPPDQSEIEKLRAEIEALKAALDEKNLVSAAEFAAARSREPAIAPVTQIKATGL